MYLHARGQGETTISRADWRVISYRDIQQLVKTNGKVADLKCPPWLKQEVEKFTLLEWLDSWDKRTGIRKGAVPMRRKRKVGAITSLTGDKNLFSITKRERKQAERVSRHQKKADAKRLKKKIAS